MERFSNNGLAPLAADLLERDTNPRSIPDERYARLAVRALFIDHQEIFDRPTLLHTQRMVGRIAEKIQVLRIIDRGCGDRGEACDDVACVSSTTMYDT